MKKAGFNTAQIIAASTVLLIVLIGFVAS